MMVMNTVSSSEALGGLRATLSGLFAFEASPSGTNRTARSSQEP